MCAVASSRCRNDVSSALSRSSDTGISPATVFSQGTAEAEAGTGRSVTAITLLVPAMGTLPNCCSIRPKPSRCLQWAADGGPTAADTGGRGESGGDPQVALTEREPDS